MQLFTTFERQKLLLIFLLASQGTVDCKISFGKLSTVVGLVQKGADLVSQMFDFVQSSKKSDNEELVQQYTAELDRITEELKSGILLALQLHKIDETQSKIESAKIDLESWLRNAVCVKNDSNEDPSRSTFLLSASLALSGIRSLPFDMVANVHGVGKNAVELFADEIDCKMTEFNAMKETFLELVQDGIIIEFMYLKGKNPHRNLTLDEEKQRWTDNMEPLLAQFEQLENACFLRMEQCLDNAKTATSVSGSLDFGSSFNGIMVVLAMYIFV